MSSRAKQFRKRSKPAKSSLVRASVSGRLSGHNRRRKGSRETARSLEDVAGMAEMLSKLASVDLGSPVGDVPLSDMSLRDVEALALSKSLFKKFEDVVGESAESLAIAKFLERNRACGEFRLEQKELFDDLIDGLVRDTLERIVHPYGGRSAFGLAQISAGFQVGPGASIGVKMDDFLTKVFYSSLSCTDTSLHTFYVYAIRGSTWAEAERQRQLKHNLMVVDGSRLSCVPKNVDIMRVICTEPILNMLFQKGIGKFLEDRIKSYFGIDLSLQPEINKELARQGSIDQKYGTIDLEGASDCISNSLCEALLPRQLLWWLKLARSPYTTLPNGEKVKLEMISSMGNAFTFPLQTMIFASVVKACYEALGISIKDCRQEDRNFGVFGDDIIVRRDAYNLVCRTLNRYGFKVNDGKSFNSGFFRESCGGDYWRGYLVRGVYIRSLRYDSDILSAYNRLVRWSARTGIKLDLTLWFLKGRLRRKLVVPYQTGDTCGIKAPFEYAQQIFDPATRSPVFRGYSAVVRSYAVPTEPGDWVAKDGTVRCYNGSAVLVALLGGYIRDGRVGLREKSDTVYKVRWMSVPNWDFIPQADAKSHRGENWKVLAGYYLEL